MNLPARPEYCFARTAFQFAPTARDSSRAVAFHSSGGEGRIRTSVGIRRQIYSLLPLATWVPLPESPTRNPFPAPVLSTSHCFLSVRAIACSTPRCPVSCSRRFEESEDVRFVPNNFPSLPERILTCSNMPRSFHETFVRSVSIDQAASTGGADGQTRTGDLLITNQLLYQLSYIGNPCLTGCRKPT